jgi:hypothetical protein
VKIGIDISVNQSELLDLSISGEPRISTYTLSNKKVDLKSVLTLSGGAPDISAVYTVSGGTGLVFSISGSILTYVNAGLYPIIVSMSGGTNYSNNKSVKTDISVNQARQADLTISGIPGLSTYTVSNKTVNLPSKISLSGGAADLSPIYTAASSTDFTYSISGTTLYYQNAGSYPVIVSISGGTNYFNDVDVGTDISVNRAPLLLSISGIPTTRTYSATNKTFDLTSALTLSGGSDLSAIYSVSGSLSGFTISGTTLTYTNAGRWPITISMSGGDNYLNDVQIGADISINRAPLSMTVSGTPLPRTYTASNKTVDLSSAITLSGGAVDLLPVYSVSGGTAGYTISGTILSYTNFGRVTIAISLSGGINYSNSILRGADISINKATISLTASGAPLLLSTYSALNKTVDLTQISLSGGAVDLTPVYSVSGSTGGYSISGSILTYQNRGRFPIAVSISGGVNYTNNVKIGIDISVNQSELLDLSISGEPRISTYTPSNKTVDLSSVLTLSGGAPDISAVYTISGGTGLVFSISGSILTYVNAGLYPIIVSMSGGTNYSNNKFVKTDISVNQATQADLTISGIPGLSTYTLSNKTVNLPSKISLSGGAADLSPIYTASSTTDFTYSISGTTLTYQNAGSYPVIVSISGGTNYFNDVSAATDISVNRSSLLPLSISGTPNPKTYSYPLKVIDLTTVFTLSGGANDISAVYTVSGEDTGLTISGTTLYYTDAGKFPITISMSGGMNYDNDVQVVSDISINKGTLTDLSIFTYEPSTYTLSLKTVELTSVLSISGGAPDVPLNYSVSGTTTGYSISGSTLYYENAGIYPIAISMSGEPNYQNNKTIGFDISVNKADLLDLSISGEPRVTEYNLQNKTVDLTSVLTLSGGAQDISAVYTISGETGLVFSISGTILTYQDVGTYPIIVSMSGSNYNNFKSVKTDISVNQSTLLDLTISGEPIPSDYNFQNKTVDLTTVLTLSGGAQDISAVYTYSGEFDVSISGTILTYVDVGTYPIIVSMSGGTNYSNNKQVMTDISVNPINQTDLTVSGEPRISEYNLQDKTVDLTTVLTLSGGAVDISAVYTVSSPGLDYSISGTILTYKNIGIYPITISISGGKNYLNDVSTNTDISINPTTLQDLTISANIPQTYTYPLKFLDLTSVLTLSGGAQDLSAVYTVSGADNNIQCLNQSESNSVQIESFRYIFNNVPYDSHGFIGLHIGTYQLTGIPSSHPLGFVINDTTLFEVTQGTIFSTNTVEGIQVTYYTGDITFQVKGDFNTISYACYYHGYMGGQTRVKYSNTCSPGRVSISGTILSYFDAGLYPIIVSMTGGTNYLNNVQVEVDISINQATLLELSISGEPRVSEYTLQNKTVDLTTVLTLSGGAQDISAIYTVSGGTDLIFSISGTILTYQDVGTYPIIVSMSGGTNYSNDVSVKTDISVNQSPLLDLSISGEPRVSEYNLQNKTVDLTTVLTLSGGAQDLSAVYTVISGDKEFSISGTILTYKDVGTYPIIVSMSGGKNYSNDTFVMTDISINQIPLSFSISGTPTPIQYLLSNKTVDLTTIVTISGGAQDISAIYSVSGTNEYSISGTIFTYTNVGLWPIIVSMSGGINYSNDVVVTTDISINPAPLLLSISGTPTPKEYLLADKTVDLTSVLTLSGGFDLSAVYRVSGSNDYSISGTILTYTNAGLLPITISMSGGINYSNDIEIGADISINKAPLSLSVSGTPTSETYTATNKTFDLTKNISLSGGALDISAIYSVSGDTGGYTISGTILTYENYGSFPIAISLSGGKNYANDVNIGTEISITKSPLYLSVSGSPLTSIYSATAKTVELTSVISLSGGASDLTPIYSVSGGTGYSISGTTLTYIDRGIFTVAISISGGMNYTNDVEVGTEVIVNPSPLLDLTISGEPRISEYSYLNKTVDLTTVLTLSGGAVDISAVYTVISGDKEFSISGTILYYEDVGTYPIIVSMSGGKNYSNDTFVRTDISVNQARQSDLSISGTPETTPYTLSNKIVDLTKVITLSGGAQDISAVYTITESGYYTISGTILTYDTVGTYPIIVSISGGTNYWNDVSTNTAIIITQPELPLFSISGLPEPRIYNYLNKNVDLTEIITISGGAQDISPVYSISGGTDLEFSISGNIFTYEHAGLFPIIVSMLGGINYSTDVHVKTDISINPAEQPPIFVTETPRSSSYNFYSKTVDLVTSISLSGGAADISAVYSVDGSVDYSISGTVLTYTNRGTFPINITVFGGSDYFNDVSTNTSIIVEQSELLDLTISGIPLTRPYTLSNKTVDLTSVLTLSGGAPDISAVYTISGDKEFSISGTILTYKDVGTYPIIVSMSGGTNYSNNKSVATEIVITQPALPELTISGEPTPSEYTLLNKTVDLTSVLTLSGGAADISAVYSVSSTRTDFSYSISGTILTYEDAGSFPIVVSMARGTNYSNDVQVSVDISVNQAEQAPLSISGEPRVTEYNLQNKTVDLTSVLTLSGGAQDISVVYSISGDIGLNFSISGSTLYYQDVGTYPIIVTSTGGKNYRNDVFVKADISVNQSVLLELSISGEPTPSEYNLQNKTVDLLSVLTLSGGAQDISAVYSISGETGLISGSTLYYTDVGLYPIIVSMSGGKNYSNNKQVSVDIRVNQAEQAPLSVSGEPTPSEYNLLNKTVDLTSVLTLSGGAQDISVVYSISGEFDVSISGSTLFYTDVGLYPIIVTSTGGKNYSNNVFVKTDISVNQSTLTDLSISGEPTPSEYNLLDKSVDLTSVLTLSGGAQDISAVYTISGDKEFSISGSTLYYQDVGLYPIIVSMSGGKNYSNNKFVKTDISINQARQSDLSISGEPTPSEYNLSNKTVDLTSVLTLSGGAQDISAVYTISGETGLIFSISGTILTYEDVGSYPIIISSAGGKNYSNDVSVKIEIPVNPAEQLPLSISGEPRVTEYNLLNKTVDLTSVLTLSGGAQDISVVYSISGETGLIFSISGTILTYEDVGLYPIIVSSTGGKNYRNDVFVKTEISVNQSTLTDLSISGEPIPTEYNLLNKTVDLTKVLTLSGGAQDISAVYSISGDKEFSISGSILYYKDVGTYPIIVSMSGGKNYSNYVSVKTDISVNQSVLLDLSISGEPRISEYNLLNKSVDLTSVLTLSGGAQDISAVYTISGGTGLEFSISGTILTYKDVGLYPIIVSMSGGTNYSNNKSVKTDISVNKSTLLDLSISGEPRVTEYNLQNKTVDLTKVLTLSGGAQDISAVYSISGETGLEFSISGTILTYKDVGLYPIIVSMSGGTNYSNNKFVKTDISVNQSTLLDLTISGEPTPSEYNLLNKTVDLTKVLTLSGGAQDISAVYSISGETGLEFSISGTILTYKDVGKYPIIVSMSGGKNYSNNKSVKTDISVNQAVQPPISISGTPEPRTYTLSNKKVDLTTVLTLSGGAPDLRSTVFYSVSGGDSSYTISGSIFSYENAGTYPIAISISGGKNYLNDVTVGTDISINQDIQPDLFVVGTPLPSTFQTTYKTVDLIMAVTLSGGAPDLSSTVIYSVSGDDTTYSISGSTFSYENAGRFPISISISGGKNYANDVITGTDISINKATVPLSISGTPSSYVFSHFSRTVTLSSAISLSGGSPGVSAIFSGPNVIDGTLMYTDVSSYPIQVLVPGGINYTDTSAATFISITKDTIPLSISGTPTSYTFNSLNKNVNLSEAISLSGGALGAVAVYSGPNVSGSILTYTDVSSYPVNVSVFGAPNYTDTFASTSISITKATVPLTISGSSVTYSSSNKNVILSSATILLSGGSPGVTPIYSGTAVNGSTLTYTNAGSYTVNVFVPGGINYTDTSASTVFSVTKATIPLSVSQASTITYNPVNKDVSLLSAISISGGAQDVSARYNGAGVNGTTLTFTDAGSYLVNVTISGGDNYTDTAASTLVVITKATQQPSFVLNSYTVIYDPRNKSTDLSGRGSGGIDGATTRFSGTNVQGTTLTYTTIGDFPVTATKSFPNYFDSIASYIVTVIYPNPAAGATADELKAAGYSLSDLFGIGYTIAILLNAGYTSAELKVGVLGFGGFTETQLAVLGYTALQLQTAAYTATELKSVGFTLLQLIALGYTTTTLLAAGYTDSELKTVVLDSGFTSEQLTALGYTALQLQNAGYTDQELRSVGYTPNQLFDLGFTTTKLLDAGYTPVEMKLAVLEEGGRLDLTSLGYTAEQLQEQEYTATELKSIGYTLPDLLVTGYTTGALYDAGYTATEIQNAVPIAGYTVPQLRDIGFTPSQLRPAGYFLSPMVDAGYTTQDLKDALFTPADLLTYFPARELYNIFTTPKEQATVTKAVVSELFSPSNSKVTGLPVTSMVGYTFQKVVNDVTAVIVSDPSTPAILTASDFKNGSTAVYAIIDVLGSSLVLPTQNSIITILNTGPETYRVYDASGLVYRDNLLAGNTIRIDGLTVLIGSVVATMAVLTVSQLIARGLNTSSKLIDAGYDATKLELAGYTATFLEIAGFTAAQLIAVGYTATRLQSAGYNAQRLLAAGFTAVDLETVGYAEQLLRDARFTAAQLQAAGYTASQLRDAGFTVCELQALGYTSAQLVAAGFSRTHKPVKKGSSWLTTNSEHITFPEKNEILCHASTATGETVTTMEGYKTCVLTFKRPGIQKLVSCSSVEKRYATVTLYSNIINTETYALTFRTTRNISGTLLPFVSFELNGIVVKSDFMEDDDDGSWDSFSMILHENDVTVLANDSQWYVSRRKVSSSTSVYKAKFNLNHDKTNIKNIDFRYFQNAANKISYTVPVPAIHSGTNVYTFDYQEGAIHELRDISAGGPTLTLYVQNMNYDLISRIPVISTLIKADQRLSSNAYTTRIYLNQGETPYDVIQTDTSANIHEKLIRGKTVIQDMRYFNTDGSGGHILSDIHVYM